MAASGMNRWSALLLLLLPFAAQGAEGWTYSYQGIDVTTTGTPQYAQTLAHNMRRLDTAIVKVLALNFGDWRPPTHIYAVSPAQLLKLRGSPENVGSEFTTSGVDNVILMETAGAADSRYWGAYFGYSGSLLLSEGVLRYPNWFQVGVSEVFGATSIQRDRIKIGGFLAGTVRALYAGPLIPLRTLLRLRADDPQLRTEPTGSMYYAECWFLAHQILIERLHGPEFFQYLDLMSSGKSESEAFAASFKVSYEELDQALAKEVVTKRIGELTVTVPDEPGTAQPVALSAPELKGRLAELAVTKGHDLDYGVQLASEALAVEPANEHALRALAVAQVRQQKYGEALTSIDRLAANASPSAGGYADSAGVLLAVSQAIANKKVMLQEDPVALAHRAFEDYQHAIMLDKENVGYWTRFAEALANQHDVAAAKDFLPKGEQVFYLHPHNPNLARSISQMYSQAGDLDGSFKFAVAWQNSALDDKSRDSAASWVSRVKASMEKRDVASPTKATQSP